MDKKQLKQFEDAVRDEIQDALKWAKGENQDLQQFAKEVSALTAKALAKGYSGLLPEMKNQVLLLAEIARIRLSREMKTRLSRLLGTALKIGVSLL